MLARFAFKLIFILGCFQLSCGPNQGSNECGANVVDVGMQLKVTALSSNVMKFTLCADIDSSTVYTVYGGTSESSVAQASINVNASWRNPPHITSTTAVGNSFQVTFQGSDNFFAIYEDVSDGMGGHTLSSATVLVNARELPSP